MGYSQWTVYTIGLHGSGSYQHLWPPGLCEEKAGWGSTSCLGCHILVCYWTPIVSAEAAEASIASPACWVPAQIKRHLLLLNQQHLKLREQLKWSSQPSLLNIVITIIYQGGTVVQQVVLITDCPSSPQEYMHILCFLGVFFFRFSQISQKYTGRWTGYSLLGANCP